jgi:ABC-type transporter Mla MlaB component
MSYLSARCLSGMGSAANQREPAQPRGSVVLVLAGEMAPADLPVLEQRLRAALLSAPGADVLCDVAAVDSPTLQTIGSLARLQVRARALGRPLALINAPTPLRELLELVGLSNALPLAADPRPAAQPTGSSGSVMGSPNSGNSASVSRNAVNSAICPPENSST